MRLDKYLAACGAGTRSQVKKLIRSGEVQVEGLESPGADSRVDPAGQRVWLRGTPLVYHEFVYLMLNKPQGYLSATRDGRKKVVLDLVPEPWRQRELFPVGRLDIDTEGFCLLCNDGQLAHRLLSPVRHVPKTYYAEITGEVTQEDAAAFAAGIILEDGYFTKPAKLEILQAGSQSRVHVEITEGKFHQIKRMFACMGKSVDYLKRIKINGVELDPALAPGELRELTPQELELLQRV